jgi:hypothetical protein
MNNFTHVIRETVEYFDDVPYQINVVIIKINSGKFIIEEIMQEVIIFDDNTSVKSFNTRISPNQKELISLRCFKTHIR